MTARPEDTTRLDSICNDELDDFSATTTLASSIYKYRKENGRTYHAYKDGQYAFPNDNVELDRLDLQHCIFLMSLKGKLHLAPIDEMPKNVLDIGTGSGLWAIDFADGHPDTQVVGIDLSPTQPSLVPPNCHFHVDDANEDWTFFQKFDFIFARQLHAAVEPRRMMEQAHKHLKPGGWLELQELCLPVRSDDGSLSPDSALSKCYTLLIDACRKINQDPTASQHYASWLVETGFVNVQQKVIRWASNSWPPDPSEKEIGQWTLHNVLEGIEGFTLALFTRVLGWKEEEVQLFLADVRKDLKNKSIHAYWPLFITYGQKPEGDGK